MLRSDQVLDRYFPEVRAWLIQIAAVMDRHDRAADADVTRSDARLEQLRASLEVLRSEGPRTDRAAMIQRIFSDPV